MEKTPPRILKTVCIKDQCTGCMACVDSCSKKAIKIIDNISSYNAIINDIACINCGRCRSICQVNIQQLYREPIYWKQGWATDVLVRERASSGGAASAIALSFIRQGGTVFSCTFINGKFTFEEASTEEEVIKFCGSKYVKSNPFGIYKQISLRLNEGKQVLFIGLPCQVAALINYTKQNKNLFTIDLICHGTPSPKVLEMALCSYGYNMLSFSSIKFRSKTIFETQIDDVPLTLKGVSDFYTHLFLNGISYTENCYSCKYARKERISDITVGDSWGSEIEIFERKKGISLILCQTEKGLKLLKSADLILKDVDLDNAIKNNKQLHTPMMKPEKREEFFVNLKKYSFFKSVRCVFPIRYYKNKIKTVLLRLNLWPGGGKNNIEY